MTPMAGNGGKASLYDGKPARAGRAGGWIGRALLLLAALLAAHFLNLLLQWTLIRGELAAKPLFRSPEYTFIGFAPLHGREIAAIPRLPNAAPAGRVFACFDFLHPAVFRVWNNAGPGEFFDLGPVLVSLPAGASRVSFLPGSVLRIEQEGRVTARNFGASIVGSWLARRGGGPAGSFIVKAAERSPSLRIPYLVYFFLPLALVAAAAAVSGTWALAALFYYAGMFFFFDFERLFAVVPLGWLFRGLGMELGAPWLRPLAAAVAALLTLAAFYGLLRWRRAQAPPCAPWLALFFILLPPCLFF